MGLAHLRAKMVVQMSQPWLQQDLTSSGCPIIAGKPGAESSCAVLKSKASCKSYEDLDKNGTQIFQTFPNIQVQCSCVTSDVSSFFLHFRTVPVKKFRRCLGFLNASQDPERSCMQGCRIPSNGALGGWASQKLPAG